MRSWHALFGLGAAFVAIVAIVALVAVFAWPDLWAGAVSFATSTAVDDTDDGRAPPAMKECMQTCTQWHLVGSLYHRGFCADCESLTPCAGQKEQPTDACMDALRSCYHQHKCVAATRVACDKRCATFLDSLGRGHLGTF